MTSLTGTATLVRLVLRRDRIRLPIWIVAIWIVVLASANAVQGVYPTAADRATYAATMSGNPTGILMSGPTVALDTLGGISVFEVNLVAYVGIALMALFLVVRHTRTEEATGRTELLRATTLGRHAGLAAAVLVVSGASLVTGAGIAAGFLSIGLSPAGAWVFGAAVAAAGIVFTGIGAAAAQVTENPRAALGIGGLALAVAWLLRAIGDIGNGVASWVSPIGWSQAVHAFADNRWWPLVFSCLALVALAGLAVTLANRRDVGAGLIAPRLGRAHASPGLGSTLGLATRLQRTSVLSWAVGLFLGGLAAGSFSGDVEDMFSDRPELTKMLAPSGGDLVDAYFAMMALILALIACGFALSSASRLRSEETAGRAEVILATRTSRAQWMLQSLAVTFVGSVLVVGAGGLGLGLSPLFAAGGVGDLPRLLAAMLVYLPAVWLLSGILVLLVGWAPRATAVVWALLAGCFVVGYLGELLGTPEWLRGLSPFQRTPGLPAAEMAWLPLVVMAVVAGVAVALGGLGVRRRDIG